MKISAFKRFLSEQFQGAPDWFIRFLSQLNLLTEQIVNTLNKNVTIQDNLNEQIYTFTILAGATADLNTISFTPTIKGAPVDIHVGNVAAGYQAPIGAVQAFWSYDGKTVSVYMITGLMSGTSYTITLVVR